jgi:hypothetical protein
MARRLSTGISGKNVLGDIVAVNNSLRSVVDNANVILQPNGTGISVSVTDLQVNSANSLRLADSDSSNFIGLRAPATVASNVTLTLPNTAGSSDQFLRTDGSGNLTWVTPFVSVANQTADSATYYPTLTTATSGTVTTVGVSNSKLTFQPSTGILFATIGQFATINGSTASSGTLTLVSTSNATKSTAGIRMTENIASSTTTTGTLTVSGGVGIAGQLTATTIVETSSIVFKENINPITGALDKITSLTGVIYDRKDGSIKNEPGLIAEEVDKIIPNLVTRDEHGNVYGLQYTKMVAYLIESIKELKQEIDSLRK